MIPKKYPFVGGPLDGRSFLAQGEEVIDHVSFPCYRPNYRGPMPEPGRVATQHVYTLRRFDKKLLIYGISTMSDTNVLQRYRWSLYGT